jgi:hypothetical protein
MWTQTWRTCWRHAAGPLRRGWRTRRELTGAVRASRACAHTDPQLQGSRAPLLPSSHAPVLPVVQDRPLRPPSPLPPPLPRFLPPFHPHLLARSLAVEVLKLGAQAEATLKSSEYRSLQSRIAENRRALAGGGPGDLGAGSFHDRHARGACPNVGRGWRGSGRAHVALSLAAPCSPACCVS